MNINHLTISSNNKLSIPMDVPADSNFLFSALVESDTIPISDSKAFCSYSRNYFNINEKSSICGTIEDYIDCIMSVNGKMGSTYEMICVSIVY